MKIEIGVPDYPFRSLGELTAAKIKGRMPNRDIPLVQISPEDMRAMHAEHAIKREGDDSRPVSSMRGFPVYFAFDKKDQRVWLHPCPDGDYELLVTGTNTLTLPKKS